MARTDTLGNFLTDVAEAIRNKKGTIDTINASEFDTEIENIRSEINLQDKSITITENGIQNIVADEGYNGLNNVQVSVNVESSIEPPIAQDYITDGLVAWFDGEDDLDVNNHWMNRLGTDYITQKTTKVGTETTNPFNTIKSKDAYKNNMTYGLITVNDYYVQGYTIEVVGKINTTATSESSSTSTSGGTLFAFDKTASPMIQIYGSNGDFGCLNSGTPTTGMTKIFSNCVGKRYKYAICLDEIQDRSTASGYFTISYALNDSSWYTRERTKVSSMLTTNPSSTILCYYRGSYLSNGEVNCIRIYNRKLTEEELAYNYEIDKARFNLDTYEE